MLTAAYVTGKLGEVNGIYREIFVEKLPTTESEEIKFANKYDCYKVRLWSKNVNAPFYRVKAGAIAVIKGRLEQVEEEVIIVAELIRVIE